MKKDAKNSDSTIYQLKITLEDSRPAIWRRVLVADYITLEALHDIIQTVMGWEDAHLHQFIIYGQHYSNPYFDAGGIDRDETGVTLGDVVPYEESYFIYKYDFGDNWTHIIDVEKIRSERIPESLPCCIAGARACPPEDCGGIVAYSRMIHRLLPKKPSAHKAAKNRAGRRRFDPAKIDLKSINKELSTLGIQGTKLEPAKKQPAAKKERTWDDVFAEIDAMPSSDERPTDLSTNKKYMEGYGRD